MKGGPLDRTKVVLRHLPPSISKSNLLEQIDSRFAGRYRWFSFCPGKNSPKHLKHSRAYIEFNKPEDVIEFAEFFNGHVFVNEKGTQFKAIVEYAPSQRVPEDKERSKKDGREGTILKDPEYLEFLEFLAKPVENLPSAEIQLERKEAERAGAPKDVPIITPLMDYVRQKRAAKGRVPRILTSGKASRKFGGISSRNSGSGSSKRGSEKRTSTSMYVIRDRSKTVKDEKVADSSVTSAIMSNEALDGEIEGSASAKPGTKILLLKGKQKEIPNVSDGSPPVTNAATPPKSSHGDARVKQNQRREGGGRIIKSILSKDARQDQQLSVSQSEPRILTSNQIRDKRPPRPPSTQLSLNVGNEAPEDKTPGKSSNAMQLEKHERRTRNKDRPDRGVWTALRRSDGSHASDESLSSSGSKTSQVVDSAEGTRGEIKQDISYSRGGVDGEYRLVGSGRGTRYLGSYGRGGRRGSTYDAKDSDRSVVDGRTSKRVGSGHGSQERQVWVQKSSSPP